MKQAVVINVVGLTTQILANQDLFIAQWSQKQGRTVATVNPILPAVTCSMQTTYLTGVLPATHGIVGNGWYNHDLAEVQFWKQSNHLVQAPSIWETARQLNPEFTCANMFWWYNMYSSVDYSLTPRPQYWANGTKKPDCYSQPASLRDEVQAQLGDFPLFHFWGPRTSIRSSRWIGEASKYVHDKYEPTLQLIYLPHLDYCLQKFEADAPQVQQDIADLDELLKDLIGFYEAKGVTPIILSEYGISPVDTPVHLNRILREVDLLAVREESGRELLDAGASQAFAVADHQVAHIYCEPSAEGQVKQLLEKVTGIEEILDEAAQKERGLWHERSGRLMVVAAPQAWFTYYYWLNDDKAPDFARMVDIHKKPGYDPVEMFLNPDTPLLKAKIIGKLLLKKLGFNVLFNFIPLKPSLVKGSHGRANVADHEKPVFIAQHLADESPVPRQLLATDVHDLILARVFSGVGV